MAEQNRSAVPNGIVSGIEEIAGFGAEKVVGVGRFVWEQTWEYYLATLGVLDRLPIGKRPPALPDRLARLPRLGVNALASN